MKALSIHQPYTSQIAGGAKTDEYRSYKTKYRGDILICSTKKPDMKDKLCGYAICIAELYDCCKLNTTSEYEVPVDYISSIATYKWKLRNIRQIKPFKVHGQQSFFNVDDSLIKIIGENK